MSIRPAAIKLAMFVVVSLALTLVVTNTVTRPLGKSTYTYRALFIDASGLRPGDDVDIAGVRVGKVTGERLSGNDALVTFVVDRSQRFTTGAVAAIRYEDLLGARFLAIEQTHPTATTMAPGATFGPDRTRPALSLTVLFNGFKPLFDALSPAQANRLAADVVADFQGTGGAVTALLDNIAQLTGNLSKRDALISQVVDNLDVVLRGVADHNGDLAALISRLGALTHGLSMDRHRIAGALSGVDAVAASLSDLLGKGEPLLHHDIADLFLVAGTLVGNEGRLAAAVKALPGGAAAFTRSLGYGTWLNGYVCADAIQTGALVVPIVVNGKTWHSAVCRTGQR